MNKKLITSLSIIALVAIAAIGGTIAYFKDTETSSGNILVAGTMDLKVDHLKQTYNDINCNTCSVSVISDTTNMVISTDNGDDPVQFPHAAKQVLNPHPAWTVTGDIPGAVWIWATEPTTAHDSGNVDIYYTFEKTFEWWGPIEGATLSLGVGTDNGYEIKLNGNYIGDDWGEYNYKSPADVYTNFADYIKQGENTLQIKVKNQALSGGTPSTNPAGLLYKLTIDGKCEGDYFKTYCRLWGEKDLVEGDTFFNFNDIKPGDHGTNVISLHAYDNDAYACLTTGDVVDEENTIVEPEDAAEDITSDIGELSDFIGFFVWEDNDNDGIYEGETVIAGPGSPFKLAIGRISLTESQTKYIGLAWCAGTQKLDGNIIKCDGSTMGDIAQTDSLSASITVYAEQQRNNPEFSCNPLPN